MSVLGANTSWQFIGFIVYQSFSFSRWTNGKLKLHRTEKVSKESTRRILLALLENVGQTVLVCKLGAWLKPSFF